jgi:hypothetical protein
MRILKTDNKKLAVASLNICDAYQRTVVRSQVNSIARDLDQDAFGSLTIGERRDGSYWIVDGQQRCEAAKKLGIQTVPCDVFQSEGPRHEARVFRIKNKHRTNISPVTLFKGAMTEGDEQTLAIVEVVRLSGLKIGLDCHSVKWPYIRAVRALERSYRRCGGEGLSAALSMICDAWPGEDGALQGDMIEGLCWFVKKHPEYDRARLVTRLSKKSITSVIRAADANFKLGKDRDSSSYGRSLATCDAISLIYHKGMRRKRVVVD